MRGSVINAKGRDTLPNNDFLIHYGVKGQKWGIRKYQNEDGTLTSEGREHYGIGNGSTLSKVKKRLSEAVDRAADSVKSKIKDKVSEKRGPSHMSDTELNDRLARLRKEAEYTRLKREIDGSGNQNNGGKNKGGKKHPYLAMALLTPVAAAIGVGTKAFAKEKVTQFMEHRADTKWKTLEKMQEAAQNGATNITKKSLDKLYEKAWRAAEAARDASR